MRARTLLIVAAFLALLASLVLMVLDDPPPEPSQLTEAVPATVNGQVGWSCDFTIHSNGARADTLEAECEAP